jgi:hypothetical protein
VEWNTDNTDERINTDWLPSAGYWYTDGRK